MNRQVKTHKSVIVTLVAGFGIGAVTMIGITHGGAVTTALAQDAPFKARTIGNVSAESLTELRNLDTSYANLADFAAPAVVDIMSTSGRAMSADGSRIGARGGEGSGFIFRPDGYIITNDHVVGGFDKVMVTLHDGREFQGKVIRAEESDIALVKIEATGLPTLAFGDSSKSRVGQMCMAVGAPFGLKNSVTFGHLSALGRTTVIPSESGGFGSPAGSPRLYPDLIQTDAAINMGNSGGPLINIDGQVIGINSAIYSPSGASAGIGFAIPANQAHFIADMLISKGKITHAMIGLVPDNLNDYQKQQMHLSGGALVSTVSDSGPASAAGIKKGDVIVKIGSSPVTSQLDLRNAMLIYAPGSTVPVTLIRDGKQMSVDVKLVAYKMPQAPQTPQPQFDNGNGFQIPKDFNFDIPRLFKNLPTPNQGQGNGDVPRVRSGRAHLGVQVSNVTAELRSQFNIPSNVNGALVVSVEPGSVGESLGLEPGDVITSFDGKSLDGADSLTQSMAKVSWGDTKQMKFSRYGKNSIATQEVPVTFK